LISQFQSLEVIVPRVSNAWKEPARSVPNPGTSGKSRLACCAAGGGVFLLRVPFSPTGWCGLMLCVFHIGVTRTVGAFFERHDLGRHRMPGNGIRR